MRGGYSRIYWESERMPAATCDLSRGLILHVNRFGDVVVQPAINKSSNVESMGRAMVIFLLKLHRALMRLLLSYERITLLETEVRFGRSTGRYQYSSQLAPAALPPVTISVLLGKSVAV